MEISPYHLIHTRGGMNRMKTNPVKWNGYLLHLPPPCSTLQSAHTLYCVFHMILKLNSDYSTKY
jgi:hypothetical protein